MRIKLKQILLNSIPLIDNALDDFSITLDGWEFPSKSIYGHQSNHNESDIYVDNVYKETINKLREKDTKKTVLSSSSKTLTGFQSHQVLVLNNINKNSKPCTKVDSQIDYDTTYVTKSTKLYIRWENMS